MHHWLDTEGDGEDDELMVLSPSPLDIVGPLFHQSHGFQVMVTLRLRSASQDWLLSLQHPHPASMHLAYATCRKRRSIVRIRSRFG